MHAESCDKSASFESAPAEPKAGAQIPWNSLPNVAPCTNWRTCGRDYVIVEYDRSRTPWIEIERTPILWISSDGVVWKPAP